mgnify:CR=1 FL=1
MILLHEHGVCDRLAAIGADGGHAHTCALTAACLEALGRVDEEPESAGFFRAKGDAVWKSLVLWQTVSEVRSYERHLCWGEGIEDIVRMLHQPALFARVTQNVVVRAEQALLAPYLSNPTD